VMRTQHKKMQKKTTTTRKHFVCRIKFSALLLGLLLSFFVQLMIIETKMLLLTYFWDEHHATKSRTSIVGFSLFWTFFAAGTIIARLRFLRKLVTTEYLLSCRGMF
jgi:hypothetical protein